MHVSPETMKTVAFVLLMLLVAVYMHLAQAPRREPQSLVDITRHRRDAEEPGSPEEDGAAPPPPSKAAARARRTTGPTG